MENQLICTKNLAANLEGRNDTRPIEAGKTKFLNFGGIGPEEVGGRTLGERADSAISTLTVCGQRIDLNSRNLLHATDSKLKIAARQELF